MPGPLGRIFFDSHCTLTCAKFDLKVIIKVSFSGCNTLYSNGGYTSVLVFDVMSTFTVIIIYNRIYKDN